MRTHHQKAPYRDFFPHQFMYCLSYSPCTSCITMKEIVRYYNEHIAINTVYNQPCAELLENYSTPYDQSQLRIGGDLVMLLFEHYFPFVKKKIAELDSWNVGFWYVASVWVRQIWQPKELAILCLQPSKKKKLPAVPC